MPFVQLSRKCRRERKRQVQKREQGKERTRPEIPQRTKERREAGEKNCRAENCGKEQIQPQLPAEAAGEGEKAEREQQRKQNIERGGETAQRLSIHSQ